ncbi:hypothetical protein [Sphaerisporangium corydalis]|uniref:Uncharacterized protein n=1 Tax=Sphaerisporangium corydalis TaxID=1441875 RepID=A0ABV9EA07_9ACTN|nr:hypothetical protein [Sphaerisporangium corydalis]
MTLESDRPAEPERTTAGKAPMWLRVLSVPVAVVVALGFADSDGWAMGVFAGVMFGWLAFTIIIWDRYSPWIRRHPVIDGLIDGPYIFLSVTAVTSLSAQTRWAIAGAGSLVFIAARYWAHRHQTRSAAMLASRPPAPAAEDAPVS